MIQNEVDQELELEAHIDPHEGSIKQESHGALSVLKRVANEYVKIKEINEAKAIKFKATFKNDIMAKVG